MAKRPRPQLVTYTCRCGKACEAAVDSRLALLALCEACQDKRYADLVAAARGKAVAGG